MDSKKRRIFMDILFGVSVMLALGAIAYGLGLVPSIGLTHAGPVVSSPTGNPIVRENALAGTNNWEIPSGKGASTQIQAYANATSVQSGDKLTFYVSTQKEGTRYSIGIYRLGWYGGTGGRLIDIHSGLKGHAQGYYDLGTGLLNGCHSCHVDTSTGLVEANWQPALTLTVPSDWTTGVYLAKFVDESSWQTYTPFDVRSVSGTSQGGASHAATAKYVVVTPDTTYAAYNIWGGYSLYAVGTSKQDEEAEQAKGIKVSFDRPYVDGYGADQVLPLEADAIHWLERQGYDLSYISSVDLHEQPAQLLQYKAYISIGHNEYWTKEMRDGVEHARDAGVGLAFLGADAAYWQMRFEPDSAGQRDRTVVCYKVLTNHSDLDQDPLYGKDNARVTTQWRDPLVARPENALIGVMYSSLTHSGQEFPWQVSSTAQSSFLTGTGLQAGKQYGCGLVGYEWDRVFDNGATPSGLQVLSTSQTVDIFNQSDTSNTTYYIARSGALVFATGSMSWAAALDPYRFGISTQCASKDRVVSGMQILLSHIMDDLVVHH
jgi:hypothetical protein